MNNRKIKIGKGNFILEKNLKTMTLVLYRIKKNNENNTEYIELKKEKMVEKQSFYTLSQMYSILDKWSKDYNKN